MENLLTNGTKELFRLALQSHKNCFHDVQLCFTLTVMEVELRRGEALTDEELEASRTFVADCILESLILKGYISPAGIDDTGDFLLELTEAGEEAYQRSCREEDSTNNAFSAGPDHAFKPGTSVDGGPPSELWCDVCGESRAKAHPEGRGL